MRNLEQIVSEATAGQSICLARSDTQELIYDLLGDLAVHVLELKCQKPQQDSAIETLAKFAIFMSGRDITMVENSQPHGNSTYPIDTLITIAQFLREADSGKLYIDSTVDRFVQMLRKEKDK